MAKATRCTFCNTSACQPLVHNDPMSDAAPAAIGVPCLDRAVESHYGVKLKVKNYTVVRAVKVK